MSYSILYNWQFLKSEEGITPAILIGDNNVTEPVWMGNHWGERCVRNWACLFNYIGVEENKFMNEIMNMTGKEYQEHWMRNGKWVDDKALIRWAKRACKSAASVEDVLKYNPFVYISAYLSVWDEHKNTKVLETFIHNTTELDAWIQKANQMSEKQRAAGNTVFPIIKFSREDVKRFPAGNEKHPEIVIVKCKYGYLTEYTMDGYGTISQSSWNRCAKDALRLPYDEAFALQIQGCRQRLANIRLISADAQDAPYDAVISATHKSTRVQFFVSRVGKNKVHFAYHANTAQRYRDLKAAQKAAKKLNEKSKNYLYEAVEI